MKSILFSLLIFACSAIGDAAPPDRPSSSAANPPAATAPTENDNRLPPDRPGGWGFKPAHNPNPALPKVLLIGDSVCNGYRDIVAGNLAGKANVDAWVTPYHQASPTLLDETRDVLKEGGPYAVIHFNMGLHGWQKGRIPEGQYTALMTKWVAVLENESQGAKLIWASTTPVTTKSQKGQRPSLDTEINPIIVDQNALAAKIMVAEKIPVDDLYALMSDKLDLAHGDQFHWTKEGSKLQAKTAATIILENLVLPTTKPFDVAGPTVLPARSHR
jgi:hypothetical protein